MKKHFLYMAFACLALAFTACSSDDDDSNSNAKAPATKTLALENQAIDLTFTAEEAPFGGAVLSESGRAVIGPVKSTRASGSSDYILGTYTVSDNIYTIYDEKKAEYCKLTINGSSVTIQLADEEEEIVTTATTSSKKSGDDITTALCRNWSIASSRLRHKGDVTAVRVFDKPSEAASLNTILAYAKTKASIDEEFDPGMTITDIVFTRSGSFIFLFQNGTAYVGKWSWSNPNTGTFAYKWNDAEMGNKFESGNATFTVATYQKTNYYVLTLSSTVNNDDQTYDLELSFYLNEK